MELKVEGPQQTETKPKEIPVPREISQLIGMGLRQATDESIRKIKVALNKTTIPGQIAEGMGESLRGMEDFLKDLETRQLILVKDGPPKFTGEENRAKIEFGEQIIDSPLLPKIKDAIFHVTSNSLQIISGRAEKVARKSNNPDARGINEECVKITDIFKELRNPEKIVATVSEDMRVTLRPIPKTDK